MKQFADFSKSETEVEQDFLRFFLFFSLHLLCFFNARIFSLACALSTQLIAVCVGAYTQQALAAPSLAL